MTLQMPKSRVIDEVAEERRRQVEAEGWTPEHDDHHGRAEMVRAAMSYAHHYVSNGAHRLDLYSITAAPAGWPWGLSWWKPKNPRRDLIRAAALLVAEIERLDREELTR